MKYGPLPFERGTYMSAPGLEGQTYFDSANKQKIQIVKNTDAATLARRNLVKWEDASAFEVEKTTAATDGPMVAGVVDPLLGASAAVPVNAHCYIVKGSIVTAAVGTGSAILEAGDLVQPSADSDKGKVDAAILTTAVATAAFLKLRNAIGVAQASANINTNTEILLWDRS